MKNVLELDGDDVAYFSKAVLEVLWASVIGEATNVNFVRLSGAEFNTGARQRGEATTRRKRGPMQRNGHEA